MTTEAAVLVRLDGETPGLRQLVRDLRAADKRARLALPGERTDIVRVETLASQLERQAGIQAAIDPSAAVTTPIYRLTGLGFIDRENLHEQPPERRSAVEAWIAAGDVAVELRQPFVGGPTFRAASLGPVRLAEEPWPGAPPGTSPKKAIALRFRQQITATLEEREPPAYIEPSGVSNTVLTETLRDFVSMTGDRVDAPVRYQDGSLAEPFPLRSVPLVDSVGSYSRELRLALLSIRHTEMDVEVDGCWLRNFDISRPRPQAETDQLAFLLSVRQFTTLTRSGPLLIHLYQTGLDPAVMGFYRALVHQLIDHPGSVAVIPKFFRHPPPDAGDASSPITQRSFFADGKPWATT